MRNRKGFVHFVVSIMSLPKCRETILFRGVAAEKLFMKICRCFAVFVIILKVISKNYLYITSRTDTAASRKNIYTSTSGEVICGKLSSIKAKTRASAPRPSAT